MAHKVDEMKEQQQNFIASFNSNNPFARSHSEETPIRTKGQNSRINLFNNIFRQKLETKFSKASLLKEGLDYFVRNFSESVHDIYSNKHFYKFIFNLTETIQTFTYLLKRKWKHSLLAA